MADRPILFNSAMVREILDGRKTQTRRVVKGAYLPVVEEVMRVNGKWVFETMEYSLSTPFGEPGDRLWVRETWAHYQTVNYVKPGDGTGRAFSEVSDGLAAYKADGFESIDELKDHIRLISGVSFEAIEVNGNRWRPSIHMPRWASRITLEITNVRVERLQDGGDREFWGEEKWVQNPWVWVVEFKRVT